MAIIPDDLLEEETLEEEEEGYKSSIAFDGVDFVRDPANRVMSADGVSAYEDWCRTCLATEQGSLFCYPDDFGIDTSEIPYATSRGEVEAILMRQITDALMADEYQRTEDVEDMEFNWIDSDSVEVKISVVGIDSASIDIMVTI